MNNIFDTIKVLGQSDAKTRAKQEEWMKTHEYIAAAKNEGDKAYIVRPDGTRTELLTLESIEERENWARATSTFIDNDGKKHTMTFTLTSDDPLDDTFDGNETGKGATKQYPSAVYTASGKLLHLSS